ncbi:hypothetical protein J7382_18260 [Shimia sp. R11_0]|uniref:hypothetical protein n=1 Tax=Shimia sp. R11_0 TaxID=2821096 RepID=UPI001ADBDD10|nr:hypothetical protein [Shimia sp. R11_0]MBO9479493.1 hypothetical protein [Shimia sp. R11_0]
MPIHTSILKPTGVAYRRFTGAITMADLSGSSECMHSDPLYKPGMPQVVNLQDVTDADIGFREMRTFAALTHERYRIRGEQVHICIVCKDTLTGHLAKMFQALTMLEDDLVTIDIVTGFPEALAHLDLPAESLASFPPECRDEAYLI